MRGRGSARNKGNSRDEDNEVKSNSRRHFCHCIVPRIASDRFALHFYRLFGVIKENRRKRGKMRPYFFLLSLALLSAFRDCNSACVFSVSTKDTECWGLSNVASATTPASCRQACCDAANCALWQFCVSPAPGCPSAGTGGCWIGNGSNTCHPVEGWNGETLNAVYLTVPPTPQPIPVMGNATSPSGQTISIDSTSLRFGGQPVLPRMGEVQFSRVPAEEWLDTLSAARAGGLSTIGTYVFWIHHEEQQGVWRWDGQRDLRSFVQLASSLNLTVVIRAGPWAHGECRNGGFPDWLQHMPGIQLRSLQPLYMQYVTNLYQQIAAQLKGLYWSDGGPVIGM